jgi:hypothetical protein
VEKNVIPASKENPFPHADTDAASALQSAINKSQSKKQNEPSNNRQGAKLQEGRSFESYGERSDTYSS